MNFTMLDFENVLRNSVLPWLKEHGYYPFGKRIYIYRETSAQAFDTLNGDIDLLPSNVSKTCRQTSIIPNSINVSDDSYLTWRQKAERKIMRDAGVIYFETFKLTSSLPCVGMGFRGGKDENIHHPNVFDCTHFCLPGPVDVWIEMMFNFVVSSPLMNGG